MKRCGEHKVSRNDCVALTECGLRPVLNVNASVVHDMIGLMGVAPGLLGPRGANGAGVAPGLLGVAPIGSGQRCSVRHSCG